MTIRPIIFSTPMVQALLAGRKTQTRRLASSPLRRVEVGDLLWVRESGYELNSPVGLNSLGEDRWAIVGFQHAADGAIVPYEQSDDPAEYIGDCSKNSRPSIHMPRWASRLTLEVTRVRYDRLQAISEEDSKAEGVIPNSQGCECNDDDCVKCSHIAAFYRPAFAYLWNSLHDKPGERWEDDPSVVAISFTVHRANVDQVAAGKAVA